MPSCTVKGNNALFRTLFDGGSLWSQSSRPRTLFCWCRRADKHSFIRRLSICRSFAAEMGCLVFFPSPPCVAKCAQTTGWGGSLGRSVPCLRPKNSTGIAVYPGWPKTVPIGKVRTNPITIFGNSRTRGATARTESARRIPLFLPIALLGFAVHRTRGDRLKCTRQQPLCVLAEASHPRPPP